MTLQEIAVGVPGRRPMPVVEAVAVRRQLRIVIAVARLEEGARRWRVAGVLTTGTAASE